MIGHYERFSAGSTVREVAELMISKGYHKGLSQDDDR